MLVDDHPGFRKAIKRLLAPFEADFVKSGDGNHPDGEHASFEPEIVVVDIPMNKGLNCANATAEIRAAFPGARVFMMAQHTDPDLGLVAKAIGVDGYLLKGDPWRLHLVNTARAE